MISAEFCKSFTTKAKKALGGVVIASLSGCALFDRPEGPSMGIVYEKDEDKASGLCLARSGNICVVYDSDDEFFLNVGACRRDQETSEIVLADEKYLQQAVSAPSDFKIIHEGTTSSTATGDKFDCNAVFKVDKLTYDKYNVGDLYKSPI